MKQKKITVLKKNQDWVNIVKLSDWHVPFESVDAIRIAFEFCKHLQPDIIVIDEAHDFYSLSRFDKDPARIEASNLQNEITRVEEYFKQLRSYCPKSKMYLLESNHLRRLKKFLWRNAPGLNGLKVLKIKNLLNLDKYAIEYVDHLMYRDFMFKHGDIVRKFSGYTAKGEFDREFVSGMSGHSHRGSVYYVKKRGGFYAWSESGCLCELNPEYVEGVPDWIHGLGLVTFRGKSKHFFANFLPIVDNELMFGNTSIRIK